MNTECVFCRIVAGELPATKIYEDSDTLAFMDVSPIVNGHTLVVPKTHYDPITETPLDVLGKLIAVVQKVCRAQFEGLGADGINVTQANGKRAGQIIPHVHFHVIPRFENDEHSWNWTPRKYDSQEEMNGVAERIRLSLKEKGRSG